MGEGKVSPDSNRETATTQKKKRSWANTQVGRGEWRPSQGWHQDSPLALRLGYFEKHYDMPVISKEGFCH